MKRISKTTFVITLSIFLAGCPLIRGSFSTRGVPVDLTKITECRGTPRFPSPHYYSLQPINDYEKKIKHDVQDFLPTNDLLGALSFVKNQKGNYQNVCKYCTPPNDVEKCVRTVFKKEMGKSFKGFASTKQNLVKEKEKDPHSSKNYPIQQSTPTSPSEYSARPDSEFPLIELPNSITVHSDNVILEGRVTDDSSVAILTADGKKIPLKTDGSFSVSLYVPSGGRVVKFDAIDTWNKRTHHTVKIIRPEANASVSIEIAKLDPRKISGRSNSNSVALIIGVEVFDFILHLFTQVFIECA